MENVGEKIKVLRKYNNIKQQELSCKILNRTSLSKIENGKLMPTVIQLQYIADFFNVDINMFTKDNKLPFEFKNIVFDCEYIEKAYNNEKYLDIIEEVQPNDFLTYFYVGMSYYKVGLISETLKNLKYCEKLFLNLQEEKKFIGVEKLCCAINCIRKITINNIKEIRNKEYLDKCMAYIDKYQKYDSEIYYMVINNISAYYIVNNEFEKACNFIEHCLQKNIKIVYTKVIPHIHFNYSIASFAMKNYECAIREIHKAIFFFNYIGDKYQEGECNLNLFNYYLYSRQFQQCEILIEKLKSNCHHFKLEERFKMLEIILLYNKNNYEEIIKIHKGIKLDKLIEKSKIDFYFIMGRVYSYYNNFKKANYLYKKCIKYLENSYKYLDLSLIYKDLFNMTNENKYYIEYQKYKKIYNLCKYNSIHPNLTIPKCSK